MRDKDANRSYQGKTNVTCNESDLDNGLAMRKAMGDKPVIVPRDMETVEKHCEDIFDDIIPYTDSIGNTYDFGFGLNWNGTLPKPVFAKADNEKN